MSYGHVSYGSLQTADRLPPAPAFQLGQLSNTEIVAAVEIPPRPDLEPGAQAFPAYLELIVVGAFGDVDPLAGVDGGQLADAVASLPGGQAEIINLTDADQGGQKVHSFVIPPANLGQKFWVAAVIRDEG